jgi:hypothetical protein
MSFMGVPFDLQPQPNTAAPAFDGHDLPESDIFKNPYVQSLHADLRRASRQVVLSAEVQSKLVDETVRLNARLQAMDAELQSSKVNGPYTPIYFFSTLWPDMTHI